MTFLKNPATPLTTDMTLFPAVDVNTLRTPGRSRTIFANSSWAFTMSLTNFFRSSVIFLIFSSFSLLSFVLTVCFIVAFSWQVLAWLLAVVQDSVISERSPLSLSKLLPLFSATVFIFCRVLSKTGIDSSNIFSESSSSYENNTSTLTWQPWS